MSDVFRVLFGVARKSACEHGIWKARCVGEITATRTVPCPVETCDAHAGGSTRLVPETITYVSE
jgi:hypothetical protein